MEQKNNEQNAVIFQISDIISRMSNQTHFLIRNRLLLNQLDIDTLMKNTRDLYDLLCSINCNMDADAIPMEIETSNEETTALRQDFEDKYNEEIEEDVDIENEESTEDIEEDDNEEILDNLEDSEEDIEGTENVESEDLVEDENGDEDEDNDEDIEDSGIRTYIKETKEEPQTIGSRLEQIEDTSLAARLQRKPVNDLMSAIDINDRFLLLNELFNGSMEKYNKSIRALNGFSTLFGAKTYMSELQIEFQWDCESDAYKKLADLVERRFS